VRANLAVSLNAVDDATRTRLMPVNRRWNIAALLDACREVPAENRYRITFEYVLMEGLTDRLADAHALVRLLHGFKCKVNLIPYNAYPGSPYRPSPEAQVRAFQRVLLDRGLLATVRISKGQDIQAACGQLVRDSAAPLAAVAG
jgi:23S rRNA (adenine2503-C2)-methyltransferase